MNDVKRRMAVFFDADHYAAQIGDAKQRGLGHYLRQGEAQGHDPGPYFAAQFYKRRYPDWADQGATTALQDLVARSLAGQMRQPHPLIDPAWYLAHHPDLAAVGAQAAVHFALHGDDDGRSPSAGFDAGFYRQCYMPLNAAAPFRHYVTQGAARGFLPCPPAAMTPEDSSRRFGQMLSGLSAPLLLVANDAQQAGVPLLTLQIAQAAAARGWQPVFVLLRAGPLLSAFQAQGPVAIMAEGWDIQGIAHAMSPGMPAIVNTAAAAGLTADLAPGRPCLQMLHEMPEFLRDHGLMPAIRDAAAAGARIIVSMPAMARNLADDIGDAMLTIQPGLVAEHTPLSSFRARRSARTRGGDGPVFIGAGHADHRKGFDLFIEAAQAIAAERGDARFVWLGAVDPWAQGLADKAILGGLDLTLPGFVQDALAWYHASDVYLLTSRQDPGPATVMHAARVGTPFVGYAADIGLRGVADDFGQFIPPGDRDAFVRTALDMADRPRRRDLRREVVRRSDFDRYVDALLALLSPDPAGG
ncbi:glycosyltransferase [Paracoccus indicus]|uniref:glycosyltransferase n=1 Tax=Paracoccus indicus TaxID=2079229 RepID=UPI0013B3617B|nr:glycosyltransferase [Paracoccus indicus]